MYNLIKKDLLVQKKTFKVALLYSIFVFFAFNPKTLGGAVYIMGITAIAYLFILYSVGYDDKNKCEVMLNSLPIKRSHIVYAKYTAIFIYILIGSVIMGVIGAILKLTGFPLVERLINMSDIVAAAVAILALSMIYYPVYFKLGYMKSRYVNMFIFLFIFFVPALLGEVVQKIAASGTANNLAERLILFFSAQQDWVLMTLVMAFMVVLLLLSMSLSMGLYRKREF